MRKESHEVEDEAKEEAEEGRAFPLVIRARRYCIVYAFPSLTLLKSENSVVMRR